MRKPEIGDQYIDFYDNNRVFEVIRVIEKEHDTQYRVMIKGISGDWSRFNSRASYVVNVYDKFIGNFSKSNNFQQIYNILNS